MTLDIIPASLVDGLRPFQRDPWLPVFLPLGVSFALRVRDLPYEDYASLLRSESFQTVVASIVEDWRGVMGDDDQPLPFSEDGLRTVLTNPGVEQAVIRAWKKRAAQQSVAVKATARSVADVVRVSRFVHRKGRRG